MVVSPISEQTWWQLQAATNRDNLWLFGFSLQDVKISKAYLFLPAGKLGNKLPKKVFCRVSEVKPYQSYRMVDLM